MSPCGGIVADTQQHDVRIVPGVQQIAYVISRFFQCLVKTDLK